METARPVIQDIIKDIDRVKKILNKDKITAIEYKTYGEYYSEIIRDDSISNKILYISSIQDSYCITNKDLSATIRVLRKDANLNTKIIKHLNSSDEELVMDLRKAIEISGKKNITKDEYKKFGGKYAVSTIQIRLGDGSWNKALKRIGAEVKREMNISFTQNDLINDLRIIAEAFGKDSLTSEEYKRNFGKFGISTIENHLGGGSWTNTLVKAGFNSRDISDEILITELLRISDLLGKKSFSQKEFNVAGGKYIGPIIRRFGWNNALVLAGLFPQITESNFLEVFKQHKVAKIAFEIFGCNEADVVNILSVISGGVWDKNKMLNWFKKPKMTKWLGEFSKPDLTPQAILEISFELMPYDKIGLIRKILLNRLISWANNKLGPRPNKTTKDMVMAELQENLNKLSIA